MLREGSFPLCDIYTTFILCTKLPKYMVLVLVLHTERDLSQFTADDQLDIIYSTYSIHS